MELVERKFEEFNNLKVSFYTTQLETETKWKAVVLVIRFESVKSVKRGDLAFMNAMKLAAVHIWGPNAIILDFRELHYIYGDTMEFLFSSPFPAPQSELEKIFMARERPFPIVSVTSGHCVKGLTSLVRQEMLKDPSKLLFNSFEEAAAAVAAELKENDHSGSR